MDLGIDFAGVSAYESIKGEMPAREEIVRVTGKQFNWDVTYPGSDGAFDTADDLTLENELHVPVGTVVHVVLESKDVIHSFFVPVFRLKQDVLPGRSITAWFEATETGEYEIGCAELCGYGHYKMRAVLTVHSAVDYASWIQEQWGS
jgi:cytochrome c oxidase subunit 2